MYYPLKRKLGRVAAMLTAAIMLAVVAACGGAAEPPAAGQNPPPAEAKQEEPSTYKGKTITLMIGYAPGGGVDLAGRMMAKYLSKYIPGEPKMVIKNLPGGGGISAANVLFNESKPDGMTIAAPGRGNWINNAALGESSVQYQLDEFEWIGGLGSDDTLVVVSDSTGITTFDQLKQAPADSVMFGAWQRTGEPYILPSILKEELAPAVKPVTGYKGSSEVLLALQRGEVDGLALPYSTIMLSLEADIKAGKYHILAQKGDANQLEAGVVQLEDVISEQGQQLLGLVDPPVGVTMVAPPNTDPAALMLLREAYAAMTKDPEFLAEAEEQQVVVSPVDPEGIDKVVDGLVNISPDLLEKYKALIAE